MSFFCLTRALDLSPEEQDSLGEAADKVKDVAEFFRDAFEALESSPFYEGLVKALPWVAEAADASGIRFLNI